MDILEFNENFKHYTVGDQFDVIRYSRLERQVKKELKIHEDSFPLCGHEECLIDWLCCLEELQELEKDLKNFLSPLLN